MAGGKEASDKYHKHWILVFCGRELEEPGAPQLPEVFPLGFGVQGDSAL
jgi:hypothetical protein